MTMDALHDPMIESLAALVLERLNADLQAEFSPVPAVRRVAFHSPDFGVIAGLAATELPALFVHIVNSDGVADHQPMRETHKVAFTYVLPATTIQLLSARWPALRAAWLVLRRALHEATFSNGDPALEGMGFVEMSLGESKYVPGFFANTTTAFPSFEATIPFVWEALPDAVTPQPFLELLTSFYRDVDGGNPANQPELQSLAETT